VATPFDSVLFVAFGGPTPGCCRRLEPCPGSEALCFVQGIVGDRAEARARTVEVATHYQRLGGFSPFNELTLQQATTVERLLHERGVHVPVHVGMRHWPPLLKDVLHHMADQGLRHILAVIMAPHQCFASWDWYQQTVAEGIAALGERAPQITYLDPWYTQAGHIEAIVDQLRQVYQSLGLERAQQAALIYTAHSIPTAMAAKAPYVEQFAATAAAATRLLGHQGYSLAYQSQVTGTPRPWLQPDINDAIRHARDDGYRDVIVSPIGFLCDHVEVLYDLDVAAQKTASACDVTFVRAKTVGNHPAFLTMLSDLLAARLLEG
jgi:protoporphyrin/coproporphyrin ferrochelatase